MLLDTVTIQMTLASTLKDLFHLGFAYLLAFPIGWDREKEERSAGLRTFPIVALGSCGLAMIGTYIGGGSPDTAGRVLQGLVTGIGFVGGGAIMKERASVHGTATAASIFTIGVVGAAVAFGMYHVAATLSLVTYLTLRYLLRLKPGAGEISRTIPSADDE